MKRNQKGFGIVEGLLMVLIVAVVGYGCYYVWSANNNDDSTNNLNANNVRENMDEDILENGSEAEKLTSYLNEDVGIQFDYPAAWGNVAVLDRVDECSSQSNENGLTVTGEKYRLSFTENDQTEILLISDDYDVEYGNSSYFVRCHLDIGFISGDFNSAVSEWSEYDSEYILVNDNDLFVKGGTNGSEGSASHYLTLGIKKLNGGKYSTVSFVTQKIAFEDLGLEKWIDDVPAEGYEDLKFTEESREFVDSIKAI